MVRWSTLRLIIAVAGFRGWSIHHMDVITAFFNGLLNEETYMLQPQGFAQPDFEFAHKVFKTLAFVPSTD